MAVWLHQNMSRKESVAAHVKRRFEPLRMAVTCVLGQAWAHGHGIPQWLQKLTHNNDLLTLRSEIELGSIFFARFDPNSTSQIDTVTGSMHVGSAATVS